jgi:predicted  nucleic acid-binding Zn-ribbon protein
MGTGCPKCGHNKTLESIKIPEKEIESRLKERGVILISRFIGVAYPHRLKCAMCNSKWKSSIYGKCPKCNPHKFGVSEEATRRIIEKLTGWKFPKSRPTFLKGFGKAPLELDGYNERHNTAFEHQGYQHYTWDTHFGGRKKSTKEKKQDFADLKKRDMRKRVQCLRHGEVGYQIGYFASFFLHTFPCSHSLQDPKF